MEFQSKIYDADAPTAMNVKLTEGMSGPTVKKLQENLATLRLFLPAGSAAPTGTVCAVSEQNWIR